MAAENPSASVYQPHGMVRTPIAASKSVEIKTAQSMIAWPILGQSSGFEWSHPVV
jgi:hypothetical protein